VSTLEQLFQEDPGLPSSKYEIFLSVQDGSNSGISCLSDFMVDFLMSRVDSALMSTAGLEKVSARECDSLK
jgi:hypothetical protein